MADTSFKSGSFFSDIVQSPVQTTAGPCPLPILYKDGSLLALVYLVNYRHAAWFLEAGAAAQHLGEGSFEPLQVMGKAVILLGAFEYRDTTIGPYNEVGVAILVKRTGTSPSLIGLIRDVRQQEEQGLLVLNLPVSTEIARSAGVGIWGYPKYVTGIRTNFQPSEVRIVLENEFELSIGPVRGLRTSGIPFVTYSIHHGRLLRTIVEVAHTVRWGRGKSALIKLIGNGPTSHTIHEFGLEKLRPVLVFRTDHVRAVLPSGKDIGAARP